MNRENLYIPLVLSHENIISDPKIAYQYAGKWHQYFQNQQEIYLEIWTGLWNFFSQESFEHQDKNFIWMEIKYKRLFKTAEKTKQLWVKNFVILKDFGQHIDTIFSGNEIARTYVFFPDPWHNKDRQKKHKLLQKEFLQNLYKITKIWWEFFFKTDHKAYFDDVLEIISELGLWKQKFVSYDYEAESEIFSTKKITEFESMFRWEKLKIHYAEFVK